MRPTFLNDIPYLDIVQYDKDGEPVYFTKKLKVTARQKNVVFIAIFIYSAIYIAASFILLSFKTDNEAEAKLYDKLKNNEYKGKLSTEIILPLIFWLLISLFYIFCIYRRYFEEQVVKCDWGNDSSLILPFVIYLMAWANVKQDRFPMSFDSPLEMKILFNGIGVFGLAIMFTNLFCLCRYCACKTCRNIKDVKISCMDKILEIAETNKITREFLLEQFGLPEQFKADLTLYCTAGFQIHTFKSSSDSIQLYEGNYNVNSWEIEDLKFDLKDFEETKLLMSTAIPPASEEDSTKELDVKTDHCIMNID